VDYFRIGRKDFGACGGVASYLELLLADGTERAQLQAAVADENIGCALVQVRTHLTGGHIKTVFPLGVKTRARRRVVLFEAVGHPPVLGTRSAGGNDAADGQKKEGQGESQGRFHTLLAKVVTD